MGQCITEREKKSKGKDLTPQLRVTPKAVGLAINSYERMRPNSNIKNKDAAMLTDSTVKIDMRVMPELTLPLVPSILPSYLEPSACSEPKIQKG
jgi:hypothetical protein